MYDEHIDKPFHTKLDTKFAKCSHVCMNLFNITSLQAMKYNVLLFFEYYITFLLMLHIYLKYGIQFFFE